MPLTHIIDTLHACIAIVPLAMYLVVLGIVNLSRRPLVVSGAKDLAALGLALCGFVIIGPMELFVPTATAFKLGIFVWPLLLAFYVLALTLCILVTRPRIVIYNVGPEQIRPLLATAIAELDRDSRWAGDCLYLPNVGVQLHIEMVPFVRNVQLVSSGATQSFDGWTKLESALRGALREMKGARSPFGLSFVLIGLILVAAITFWAVSDAETVAHSLKQMLKVAE